MKENKYYQISNIIPHLKHPEKCKSKIVTCRSGWEISFITKYLDLNENIIEWRSEDVIINYISPTDNAQHRYFIDFELKAKTKDGRIKTIWVEIKPSGQCVLPKVPKRITKNYIKQIKTYWVNQSKWSTAKRIVEEKNKQGQNIEFLVLTEKDCPFFTT